MGDVGAGRLWLLIVGLGGVGVVMRVIWWTSMVRSRGVTGSRLIGVVGLGSNLTGYVGVVGLGRLLVLMAYVSGMRCRLFF